MPEKLPYKTKKECRICGSKLLSMYFDFGRMPLANSLRRPEDSTEERIPLQVMYCKNCSLSQLSVVVDPKVLFSHYLYHSSVSETFRMHCRAMAQALKKLFPDKNKLTCLDIASNDGCLLREFKAEGYDAIGVEPAQNLSEKANASGIKTICSFWDENTADEIISTTGTVDVATATNVFAHVDDLHGFTSSVNKVLSPEGIFVIEFPYLRNLITNTEFDTIYHEHLSYFLLKPLIYLLSRQGMRIADLQELPIHGGTLRVIATKESNRTIPAREEVIKIYLDREEKEGLHALGPYTQLERRANTIREKLVNTLKEISENGSTIAAYGASAKGNVFVNYCSLGRNDITYIVDDTPEKQGLLYPGTTIPIVPRKHLDTNPPGYLMILAWNFAEEIMKKTESFREKGGRYIIAIPEVRII